MKLHSLRISFSLIGLVIPPHAILKLFIGSRQPITVVEKGLSGDLIPVLVYAV